MAYMFAISTECQKDGCRKRATHRVCDRINDTKGTFCKKHATARLEDLQRTENRRQAAPSAAPSQEPDS
jgi:hypothetical protein